MQIFCPSGFIGLVAVFGQTLCNSTINVYFTVTFLQHWEGRGRSDDNTSNKNNVSNRLGRCRPQWRIPPSAVVRGPLPPRPEAVSYRLVVPEGWRPRTRAIAIGGGTRPLGLPPASRSR